MILEFRKVGKASQAHGRGQDSVYTPGTYAIIMNGTEVGRIVGQSRRYMEGGSWEIVERYQYARGAPRWSIGIHLFPTLKDAKRHVMRNIKKRYPGTR